MRSLWSVLVCSLLTAAMALAARPPASRGGELLFTSAGKTAFIRSDGAGLRTFDFDVPGQATWQPGPSLSDGRRVIFLSMEPRRDGPGKSFAEFYTQTPTHIWLHDLVDGSLSELCTKERIAPFQTPALLIGDDRLLVQVVQDGVGRMVSMNLDGSDPRDFTTAGEGLPYGFSLSPDGRRVAFHLAGSAGYQVMTANPNGGDRSVIAAAPGHLFFGTSWSPSGEHILYVDCVPGSDPGHDWADVCIGRADGSEHRVLTSGSAMWFAASYGPVGRRGGGSNLPAWSRDGTIIFPRRSPESRVPWRYRVGEPDLDHFNRDFRPNLAAGGVCISRLDPATGVITDLTPPTPGVWDFRASESHDGQEIVYCRAATGQSPEIRVMSADGTADRMLTRGLHDMGADHPQWLPSRAW